MGKKLEIKRKWVVERLDHMIYGGDSKLSAAELEAAREAYDFLEEHEAAGNALICVIIALVQDHVDEVQTKERKAYKSLKMLFQNMNRVLNEARAEYKD